MQAKYQFDVNFFALNTKKNDSWAWKCILNNRQQFRKGVRQKVSNGININFQLDNWCANDSFANLLNIMDLSLIDTSLKVSHFIMATNEWDTAQLRLLVDPIHLQWILATPIPATSIPDSVCWGLSGNGQSTTKLATWVAHGLNLVNPPIQEYKWIWNLDIMPKL